jgi:hypothetical protein
MGRYMKKFFNYSLTVLIFFTISLHFFGCTTSFKEMSEEEFWDEYQGRIKGKTDSTYFYQVEIFETEAEYKDIVTLDEPYITSNFAKVLKINNDTSADTTYYYTVRITQKKQGLERITKPLTDQLDIKVNNRHVLELSISNAEVKYVPPISSPVYGYKNGYYYCDIMCPIDYKAFVFLANAITIEGTIKVNTTIFGNDNKSIDGKISFISNERSGDAQIINRFFNSNPTR